ncbi:hypothetical protein DSM106972_009240 [Dulcicalothrix desertica PCC 7102]|uniref:Uncharacterized protein n=1 Tax=Dulcicalothrix desertica PCC 7102 TaxID=232991 RepID=A0A433VS21_9CYAN|nr:hypothetical protein [Dulcicalothrix desertica]RUT08871.1 hypothetical protein DSM106972_009240 [Dulcicalothrix desertica PCC 7102]TWH44113.1 hypothetical protein CAL7102_07891 [Dulcicalothrix desertica PCC 7102]
MYNSNFRLYYSTFGWTCVISRPSLSKLYLNEDGTPAAVGYFASQYGRDLVYTELHGINQNDYQNNLPDLVVYQLADGTLLAAAKAVFSAENTDITAHKGSCYIHQVEYLTVLDKLPIKLP